MSDWANNHRRNQMVEKFRNWQIGNDLKIEDGKPVPLSHLYLRLQSEGGRTLQTIPVPEGFNPALMVDSILDEVEFHGEEQRKRGVEPLYALHVHCGGREHVHYEFSIGMRPRQSHDNTFPMMGDLRDPNNMAAALVGNAIQQGNHKDTLFYGAMGVITNRLVEVIDKGAQREDMLWKRIEKQDALIDSMHQAEAARRMQDLDVEIKRANAQLIMGLKKVGAETLMPLLQAGAALLVKKGGTMMGIEEMDIDETQMKLVKHISGDPKRLAVLMEGMDDDLKGKALLTFQVINERAARKNLQVVAAAGLEGVKRPLTLDKFNQLVNMPRLPQQKAG